MIVMTIPVKLSISDSEFELLKKVFDVYVSYKKSVLIDDNKEEPISVHFYKNDMLSPLNDVCKDISLKALNVIEECKIALSILHYRFDHYLVQRADYILIQTNAGPVKIINSNMIDDKIPNSNISIVVNCKNLFQNLQSEIKKHNEIFYQNTFTEFAVGSLISLIFLIPLYYIFRK